MVENGFDLDIYIYIYTQRDLSLKGETWWMLEQAWQKILLRSRDRITPLCGAALIRIHPKYLPLSSLFPFEKRQNAVQIHSP